MFPVSVHGRFILRISPRLAPHRGPTNKRGLRLFQCLLRHEGVVLVDPAALMEAVVRHVEAKQKNDDDQNGDKQELHNS
jgi:hypothetical protein